MCGVFRRPRLQLPYSPEKEAGWDLLWIGYFKREPQQQLSLQAESGHLPLPATREAMVDDDRYFVGCDPAAIVDRTVLEVGCGAGYFPKLVARHTKLFVGIDWSGLALLVARRTCPERTEFLHPADQNALAKHVGTVDSVMCRHFVIHQNLERMSALLAFEAQMLTPGGRVYADFWLDNPDKHDGHGVYAADAVGEFPMNAVYRYSEAQIDGLAAGSGLRQVDDYPRPDKLRRFVTFERPTGG
jgi:SAM-dependent methyltransferase